MGDIKIYSDGGSRGNPGPSASAYVIFDGGKLIQKDSKYLGIGTNNQAEYNALLMAHNWLSQNQVIFRNKNLVFYLDSELVVRQINGVYKIKASKLKKLASNIIEIKNNFNTQVFYKAIPREKNKLADKLVNKTLDRIPNL